MPFQPNKITRQHVLDAVEKIEKEQIELNPSTRYDVIVNEKPYPPKEVMRYAHELMNGEQIWKRIGGEPTNILLKNLDFSIVDKSGDLYSWVDAHKKIADWLLNYENRQPELISILKELGITPLNDKDEAGNFIEMDEIDPFTFLRYIYKYGDQKRLELLKALCRKLNIQPLPTGAGGIPAANSFGVWLFSYKYERKENDVKKLWQFFLAAMNDTIDDSLFNDVVSVKGTKKAKATEGLFMINPDKYLPINGQTIPYLEKKLGIATKFDSYTEYMDILEKVKDKQEDDFPVISHEAFVWNSKNSKTSYWVFQANPDVFNFEAAIREGLLKDWTVTAHKDKIKVGDKVIIWITGKNAGCYALGEVTEEPRIVTATDDAHLWKKEDKNQLKAGIKITHNLIDKPVLLTDIKDNEELSQLKVGKQGTNFSATEEEYNALLELLENVSKVKYWGFSPGEGAKHWEELYEKGIMALGWEELGDFSKYKTKEEIANKLRELESTDSSKKNDALSCYDFVHKMSIGDIIFVKKGRTGLLGYGVVKSEYYYDDNRQYYKNCRKVEWKKKGNWEVEHGIAIKTLTDITPFKESIKRFKDIMGINGGIEMSTDIKSKSNQPKNIILYGPPGTGKTYSLKNEYFSKFTDKQSTQTKEEFGEELIKNLAWWEIVCVVMLDLKKAKVKDILEHPLLQAKTRISSNEAPSNAIWGVLQNHTKQDCPNVRYQKRSEPLLFWKNESSNWTVDEVIAKAETPELFEVLDKFVKYSPQTKTEKRYVFTTFHQSFNYEDFIEGIKPNLTSIESDSESKDVSYHISDGIFKEIADKAKRNPEKEYAIFIDEINRGNIANIFGELITLIEDDKRLGCDNEMTATLPYSKKEFGVPKNLNIIGTMNTADRSVEALDTALRRRFTFIKMNPEPQVLSKTEYKCNRIDLEKLLKTINLRIEKLLDKDHCIGHSYFLGIADRNNPLPEIKQIFSNKILPLLQEYFYGDWGKIMLLLGTGFISKKVELVEFLSRDSYGDFEDYDEKPVYEFTNPNDWTLDTFKKIYE